LFSLLNFIHAANHERSRIGLHNLFFARNLGLPPLRGLFYSGLTPEIALSSGKEKVEKTLRSKRGN